MGRKKKVNLDKAIDADELKRDLDPDPRIRTLQGDVIRLTSIARKLKVELGERDMFSGKILEAIKKLPIPAPVKRQKLASKHSPSQAILVCTDEHGEEYVDKIEMEGYAKYDWNTFLNREWATQAKAIELVEINRKAFNVSKLNVFRLGDVLTGIIHAELDRSNTWNLPVAVVNMANIIAQQTNLLSAHFDEVENWCVCGNHGRLDKKPSQKNKADRNWDGAVYKLASMLTAGNPKIKWNIPRSPAIVAKVFNTKFLLKHGDGISAGGVTPYYGLARDTSKEHAKRRKREDFDFIVQGHLHHFGVVEEERILCPSMIGANQFSSYKLHMISDPAQLLMLVNEKHKIGSFHPIFLDKANHNDFNTTHAWAE